MRMSNTQFAAPRVVFSQDDLTALGLKVDDRMSLTMHCKSEDEWMRLHKNPNGNRIVLTKHDNPAIIAYVTFTKVRERPKNMPYFGTTEVYWKQNVDGSISIRRPNALTPIRVSRGRKPRASVAPTSAPTPPALENEVTLKQACTCIERVWQKYGDACTVSVDATTRKIKVLVEISGE